jgi:hypothetical protein
VFLCTQTTPRRSDTSTLAAPIEHPDAPAAPPPSPSAPVVHAPKGVGAPRVSPRCSCTQKHCAALRSLVPVSDKSRVSGLARSLRGEEHGSRTSDARSSHHDEPHGLAGEAERAQFDW